MDTQKVVGEESEEGRNELFKGCPFFLEHVARGVDLAGESAVRVRRERLRKAEGSQKRLRSVRIVCEGEGSNSAKGDAWRMIGVVGPFWVNAVEGGVDRHHLVSFLGSWELATS